MYEYFGMFIILGYLKMGRGSFLFLVLKIADFNCKLNRI